MSVSEEHRTAGRRGREIALDVVASAIERVTPAIRFLIPPLLLLLGSGVVAAVVIGHAIRGELLPLDLDDWFAFVLLMALLFAPAVLLFLFWLALTAIRELPDKLRQFPETAVRHGTTLGEIARETRERRRRFRNLGRMAKLLYSAKEDLLLYAPLLELLNPFLLIGTALSVPFVILQCLIAAAILASRVG
ncbi:MAG TPA: hypothetical protein VEX37_06930 [Thermomicrobiales bacterium]|nr:hypothetical protein [Thermomicrobiales bacterium]